MQNSLALQIQKVLLNRPEKPHAKLQPAASACRPLFQHPLPTIQAIITSSISPSREKPREKQLHCSQFSPPRRAGTVFAYQPQIAEWTPQHFCQGFGHLGRLPSETTGRSFPLYVGSKSPATGPVL
jgi:hypothetical protein